jgi:undecaprenyl-diphosphatase
MIEEDSYLQWLLLALVQGITEFLPVSSSAHLVLLSKFAGWKDQGLVMDIAAHSGSLIAVLWYFKEELKKLFLGDNWPLFFKLALASVPLAFFGYVFADFIESQLRSPYVIAFSSIFFGVLLYLADKRINKNQNQLIQIKSSIMIGLAQVLALIPGASRSGVTMTAAMAQGFNRETAARFSFLLAIPALLMTTAYGLLKYYKSPTEYDGLGILIVTTVSFVASFVSIKVFLRWIEKINIIHFMWYRVALGLLLFWYFK